VGGGGAGTGAEGGDGAFGEGAEFVGGVLGGVEGSPVIVGRSSGGGGGSGGGGVVEAAEGGVGAEGVEGLDSLGGRCHEDDFGASVGDGDSFGEGRLGIVVVGIGVGIGGSDSRVVLSDDLAFEEQFEQRAVDVTEWKRRSCHGEKVAGGYSTGNIGEGGGFAFVGQFDGDWGSVHVNRNSSILLGSCKMFYWRQ